MLASSGERITPWGVPVIVSRLRPSSVRTPARKGSYLVDMGVLPSDFDDGASVE